MTPLEMRKQFDWDTIVNYMDDEIRESVHADFAPCEKIMFLAEYMQRHEAKHGQPFSIE